MGTGVLGGMLVATFVATPVFWMPPWPKLGEIDPVVKDKWGIPALRFHYKFGDNEHRMAEDMKETAQEMFEAAAHVPGCPEPIADLLEKAAQEPESDSPPPGPLSTNRAVRSGCAVPRTAMASGNDLIVSGAIKSSTGVTKTGPGANWQVFWFMEMVHPARLERATP